MVHHVVLQLRQSGSGAHRVFAHIDGCEGLRTAQESVVQSAEDIALQTKKRIS